LIVLKANFFFAQGCGAAVLSNGSGPLDVLEEFVDRGIKSKQAG
jgi:hypothetical protein